MEIEQLLKENREEILQMTLRHGAKNIRLFGSVARGEAGESSDIDILVEVSENPSPGTNRCISSPRLRHSKQP